MSPVLGPCNACAGNRASNRSRQSVRNDRQSHPTSETSCVRETALIQRGVLVAIAFGVLLVASVAGIGFAQQVDDTSVRGEPRISVHVPDSTFTPGTTDQLLLQIANDGRVTWGATGQPELVTTARNVRVEVDDDDTPFTVEVGEQAIGAVGTDRPGEAPFTVRVPEDAEPGEYEVDVQVRFSHTSMYAPQSGIMQDRSRTVTRTIDIAIDDRPRFELHGVESDLQVGDSGTITAEVRNVGDQEARDVDVSVESTSPNVVIGEMTGDTTRIDRLGANETATVEYDAEMRPGATARNYSLEGDVRFTEPDGVRNVEEGLTFGFHPIDEQAFDLELEESTMRVGETGAIEGTIRNDGPAAVEGVTLVLEEGQFEPRSRSYSVGELDVGETADFRFRAVVPESTDPTPQRIDVTTRYRTPRDTEHSTADSLHVPVADRRDAVAVRAIDPQFAAGEDGVLQLEVTNQRDVEIRDVRFHLTVDEPLDSDFRSTVLPSLQPGETDEIAFDVEVDSNAPISQYPATVEIEYVDPDDDRVTARPATVSVSVTETPRDLSQIIGLFVFIVMVILVVAAFVWLYRKR